MEKKDLQVSAERLPGSNLEVTIVVPQKQVAKAWSQALKHIAKDIDLKGFRKGKKVRLIFPDIFVSHTLP